MKIIIIGAGELGHLVAAKLCAASSHDVIIIDSSHTPMRQDWNSLDTLLLTGEGTDVETLKRAGAQSADLLMALSGNEAANALACMLAKRLGTKRTICRVYSRQMFSEADGLPPAHFGIDEVISPVDESVELIGGILENRILQEKIPFRNPDASLYLVNVPLNSALSGVQLMDLPCTELLAAIRLAAIIRNRELLVPHGNTVLMPGDKIYVAGKAEHVDAFVNWLAQEASVPLKRVVIAGVSPISEKLVSHLAGRGLDVRVIESDADKGEQLLTAVPEKVLLIQGECTNSDILQEADVADCDAFAALSDGDENNILACLLASRLKAKKVIALTSKAEYMDILPSIEQTGCWFNITQIAANTALRLVAGGTLRVDPVLHAINARLADLTLTRRSKYAGKAIRDCKFPPNFVIAMILRGEEVITPTGVTVLQEDDKLVSIAPAQDIAVMRRNM